MSWLDQLKQASFRGVPFQVDSIEVQAGDNVVLREYPFQDLPQVFRMGEGAEVLKFSAYVIGPDYQDRREALRQVLTGDGVLVHPTAGTMRAFVADKFTMTEAPLREGGVVRFELTFVRAEARSLPVASTNTQAQAKMAADAAKTAAVDQFGAEFSLKTAPAWVQSRVVDRLGGVMDGTWAQLKQLTSVQSEFTDALTGSYQVLRSGVGDLVASPAALAGGMRDLFALPSDLADGAASTYRSTFESIFGLGASLRQNDFETVIPASGGNPAMLGLGVPEALGVDTSARRTLAGLNASVDRLVDTLALAAWVEAIAADELSGYDETTRQRALLYGRCTGLLMGASTGAAPTGLASTSWHDSVLALLSAGLGDLQARGRDQVRLTTYTPQVWMSIWQVSYLIYGTVRWADEVMTMNPHIEHPMLVPPGQTLRVVMHE